MPSLGDYLLLYFFTQQDFSHEIGVYRKIFSFNWIQIRAQDIS